MAITAERIAELKAAREEKLLERWGTGARLTKEELAEIAHRLPGASEPVVPAVPAAPAESAPVLVLESPADREETKHRSGCRHALTPGSPYETIYATSIRTVKRWRQDGADHVPPRLPPLDEPWRMAQWWREVKKRRVPEVLLALEEAGPPAAPAPVTAAVAQPPPPPAPPANDVPAATGYAATLDRMRQAEAIASTRYLEALNSPDETVRATADSRRREWDAIAEQLRRYEKDAEKILLASGNLWPAAAVIQALHELHAPLREGVVNLVRRLRPLLVGLSPTQQDALWENEVRKLFDGLRANKFTATPTSDAVAA